MAEYIEREKAIREITIYTNRTELKFTLLLVAIAVIYP
jgi:hypothetical protein